MKKTIITLFLSLVCAIAFSQTDYYKDKDTIKVGKNTYKVGSEWGGSILPYFLYINNICNTKAMGDAYRKDGRMAGPDTPPYWNLPSNDPDDAIIDSLVRARFTKEEIAALAKEEVWISFRYAVENDGTISEVFFIAVNAPSLRAIAPEKIVGMGDILKKKIRYTLHEKNYDYKYQFQSQQVTFNKL